MARELELQIGLLAEMIEEAALIEQTLELTAAKHALEWALKRRSDPPSRYLYAPPR